MRPDRRNNLIALLLLAGCLTGCRQETAEYRSTNAAEIRESFTASTETQELPPQPTAEPSDSAVVTPVLPFH